MGGAPLGFAVHNILLGTLQEMGMPSVFYYVYTVCCLPIGLVMFYFTAPGAAANSEGKGCQVFLSSIKSPGAWLPAMIPWFIAKFIGNFVLEDSFPLLYNTFNTDRVPLFGGPGTTSPTVPFQYYTAWYWFVLVA